MTRAEYVAIVCDFQAEARKRVRPELHPELVAYNRIVDEFNARDSFEKRRQHFEAMDAGHYRKQLSFEPTIYKETPQ